MKEKEPTSLKAISQATCPYPSTPRTSSQPSRSGPKFFPPDVLPEDELERAMDSIPYIPDPLSPPSPLSPCSPPDTPTPSGTTDCIHPLNPELLVFREFSVKTSNLCNNEPMSNGLANSIHTPNNPVIDHTMYDHTSPANDHIPTPEEQSILVHLVLVDMNRSVLSQNSTNHAVSLPQFTQAPTGGFLKVYMSHSMVFNHSGKDVVERAAIIVERIRANVTTIAESLSKDTPSICVSPPQPQGGKGAKNLPNGFLVHSVSNEAKDFILKQCIWSTMDITFEALPFNCMNPPDLLFGLSGFTMLDAAIILQATQETWSQDGTYSHIESLFSKCGLPDDEMIYKATRDFIASCQAKTLDFRLPGGLSVPRFNIFAMSPTNDVKTWTELRLYLSSLTYPTNLDGCGVATVLFACQICHSLMHPCGLCPFPLTPNWNGPKVGNRNSTSGSRQPGRGRGGRQGRST
ncbi:hypothetical protein BDR06DRAFT_1009007 [Suillus hirtellus]|nr:hypothetical protein BDR06DRAFT_1009007 [Suillus hirtellus]